MEREKDNRTTARRPDCVTETRMRNTERVMSGFFKEDAVSNAADKMMRMREAESIAGNRTEYTA